MKLKYAWFVSIGNCLQDENTYSTNFHSIDILSTCFVKENFPNVC